MFTDIVKLPGTHVLGEMNTDLNRRRFSVKRQVCFLYTITSLSDAAAPYI